MLPSLYHFDDSIALHLGDSLAVLRTLPDESVNCCVTSPPYYGLRDYGNEGQYGLEPSPAAYVERMRALFGEVRRVLAKDGTLWLNIGDSYSSTTKGSGGTGPASYKQKGALLSGQHFAARPFSADRPPKSLLGIPWRVAFALQDDGWILRNEIIWAKPNGMPESVTDRLASKHEHLFLFSKSRKYWFDLDTIREQHSEATAARLASGPVAIARRTPGEKRDANVYGAAAGTNLTATGQQHSAGDLRGRNPGDVWEIPTTPFPGAHFAVFPPEIPRRAILAGCKPCGTVLDPFSGSGTTGLVAGQLGRKYVGIDLSKEYLDLSLRTRLAQTALLDGETA